MPVLLVGSDAGGRSRGSRAVFRRSAKAVDWNSCVNALRNASSRLLVNRSQNGVWLSLLESELVVPFVLCCVAEDLSPVASVVALEDVPVRLPSRLLSESSEPSDLEYWLSKLLRLLDASLVSVAVVVVLLVSDRTPAASPLRAAFTRAAIRPACRTNAA